MHLYLKYTENVILCVWVYCLHVCLGTTYRLSARGAVGYCPVGVIDSFKLPSGCWESNLNSLGRTASALYL